LLHQWSHERARGTDRTQSYHRELQLQRCKNLPSHE
jgi:hypothetical protein